MDQWLSFPLGTLAVFYVATERFNVPSKVHSYVSCARYFVGVGCYGVVAVIFYYVLYLLLREVPELAKEEAVLALLALVSQMALWRVPPTSKVDHTFKEALYVLIGFPSEAHRLATDLASARFSPSPAVRLEVHSMLMRRGYDTDDSWLPTALPMRELWHSSAALFDQVRKWEGDSRYAGFVEGARHEFDVLRHRYDRLCEKVVKGLETIELLGTLCIHLEDGPATSRTSGSERGRAGAWSDTTRRVVSSILGDLSRDISFFYDNLCLLVARGVLSTSYTAKRRHQRLSALGFDVEPHRRGVVGLLAGVFLLYLVIFMCLLAVPSMIVRDAFNNPNQLAEETARVIMIACVQCLAIGLAILPKKYFGFANEDLLGRTPWRFVIGVGFAAALLSVPLELPFLQIMGQSLVWALPWLVMPFAMASSMAFLMQNSRWVRIDSDHARRTRDVLVLLVVNAIAMTIAIVLSMAVVVLVKKYYPTFYQDFPPPPRPVFWWQRPAIVFLIALALGTFVPSRLRHPPLRRGTGVGHASSPREHKREVASMEVAR